MNRNSMTTLLAALVGLAAVDAAAVDVTRPVIEGCSKLPSGRCSRRQGLLSKGEAKGPDGRVAALKSVSGALSSLGLGNLAAAPEAPKLEETAPVQTADAPQVNTGGEDEHTRKPHDEDNGKVRIAALPQANTGNGGLHSGARDDRGRLIETEPARRGRPILRPANHQLKGE